LPYATYNIIFIMCTIYTRAPSVQGYASSYVSVQSRAGQSHSCFRDTLVRCHRFNFFERRETSSLRRKRVCHSSTSRHRPCTAPSATRHPCSSHMSPLKCGGARYAIRSCYSVRKAATQINGMTEGHRNRSEPVGAINRYEKV
jgi:hypothetical protein